MNGVPGSLGAYKRLLARVAFERGRRCEACGEPTDHVHHILPVSETGISSVLAWHEANMIVLCDDCHALMHPGARNRNGAWHYQTSRQLRGQAISRR